MTSGLPEHFNFLVRQASHARGVMARFVPVVVDGSLAVEVEVEVEVEGPAIAFLLE